MRSHGQSLSILASGKVDVCVIKYHAVENDDNDEHGGDNDPFSLGVGSIYKLFHIVEGYRNMSSDRKK